MYEKRNRRVAVLLTCHNRVQKTLLSLKSLFEAIDSFNNENEIFVDVSVFLTDDGCTDCTGQKVKEAFTDRDIVIVVADGNAFWAGGMRISWDYAINTGIEFDFFVLINDDTIFKPNCIIELFSTHEYSIEHFKKGGVYSGFVSSMDDESIITYGAKKYNESIFRRAEPLTPIGIPQECTMVNANILMVCKEVVKSIGILDDVFIHAAADMDYGIRAQKAGFPVLTTSKVCACCENDHYNSDSERDKVVKMSFNERKAFLKRPTIKQYHDSLIFYKRYDKFRYFLFLISFFLNLYIPSLYYKLYKIRGH